MHVRKSRVLRIAAVIGAATLMATGLVMAMAGGDGDQPGSRPAAFAGIRGAVTIAPAGPTVPAVVVATPSPLPAESAPSSPVATETAVAAPTDGGAAQTSTIAPGRARATLPPTVVSAADDIPKYTDVAVLALAAEARLPSGKTFRECVELPPSHEKWPTPVHLYYMGGGRWLVETHISEVQVVFEESTMTFTAGNFAPVNPGCR